MLILTRKLNGPGITITDRLTGEVVTVQLVGCMGNQARFGVTADPKRYAIHRSEIEYRPLSPPGPEDVNESERAA